MELMLFTCQGTNISLHFCNVRYFFVFLKCKFSEEQQIICRLADLKHLRNSLGFSFEIMIKDYNAQNII